MLFQVLAKFGKMNEISASMCCKLSVKKIVVVLCLSDSPLGGEQIHCDCCENTFASLLFVTPTLRRVNQHAFVLSALARVDIWVTLLLINDR